MKKERETRVQKEFGWQSCCEVRTQKKKWIIGGSLPRTQTMSEISGVRIHNVQSCSRPGSSRIPRLGGSANDPAFGSCVYWWNLHTFPTSIHCNLITRKAPRLLRARTAGSTRRDRTLTSVSRLHQRIRKQEDRKKRERKGGRVDTEGKVKRLNRGGEVKTEQDNTTRTNCI